MDVSARCWSRFLWCHNTNSAKLAETKIKIFLLELFEDDNWRWFSWSFNLNLICFYLFGFAFVRLFEHFEYRAFWIGNGFYRTDHPFDVAVVTLGSLHECGAQLFPPAFI